MGRRGMSLAAVMLVSLVVSSVVLAKAAKAAPDWKSISPFKSVDADPKKRYKLTEDHGPWLILGATFAGAVGEKQANQLVLELRRDFKLPAYVYRQNSDYTNQVEGLGLNKDGTRKTMRFLHGAKFDNYAVLIGEFQSVDDPRMPKILEAIKYAKPKCLEIDEEKPVAQRMAIFRDIQRQISGDEKQRTKGPMGSAFAVRNPLLPEEFFVSKGPDPLVVAMNQDAEFSLLDCPGKFTVQVATFKGVTTMKINEIEAMEESDEVSTRLIEAADNAHKLAAALRKKGVEAYEYHDRFQSIVTVGSFESLGEEVEGSAIDLDKRILKIIKTYGAQQRKMANASSGLQPRKLNGIPFDIQPLPIPIPKVSVAAQYNESNRR